MSVPNTIVQELKAIHERYSDKVLVNPALSRALVSFQANKKEQSFRWFKYKEGFSATLVNYLLDSLKVCRGTVLDPFAGSGTTLFVAARRGLDSVGIELLPIGSEIIRVRSMLLETAPEAVAQELSGWASTRPWYGSEQSVPFPHLKITQSAFPVDNEEALGRYIYWCNSQGTAIKHLLRFAALSVLEETSYTRKDGQYLRWDHRSGRRVGNRPFHKGQISKFDDAVAAKLSEIADDLVGVGLSRTLFEFPSVECGKIDALEGSSLELLPTLKTKSIDAIITSPPYCNRYDYTRTYALELALLGVDENRLKQLRQAMLSCTVENRPKANLDKAVGAQTYTSAARAFESQTLLQSVLGYLEQRKLAGELNNNGIPRMVHHYFLEMALVIFECARVLKPGSPFIMVNDNVRYEGVHIPVDLILSDFAHQAGLRTEHIWILPTAKGNSSQQMGKHGRQELRKCIYVWRLPRVKRAIQPNHRVGSRSSNSQHVEAALPRDH